MDWFLCNRDLRHERVNRKLRDYEITGPQQSYVKRLRKVSTLPNHAHLRKVNEQKFSLKKYFLKATLLKRARLQKAVSHFKFYIYYQILSVTIPLPTG